MDGSRVTRSHCSACPSFVSFRVSDEVATVGCDWGEDVAGWLRREMQRPDAGTRPSASAQRLAPLSAAVVARRVRSGPSAAASAVGVFLAAFGVGIALSALDRPS